MDRLELIRLEKKITDDEGHDPKLMEQALQALADESSQVDARRLAKMLGVFGEALMPAAIEMLAQKAVGRDGRWPAQQVDAGLCR